MVSSQDMGPIDLSSGSSTTSVWNPMSILKMALLSSCAQTPDAQTLLLRSPLMDQLCLSLIS